MRFYEACRLMRILLCRYAWSAAGYLLISIPVFFGDILPPSIINTGTHIKTKEREAEAEADAASSKVAIRTESTHPVRQVDDWSP